MRNLAISALLKLFQFTHWRPLWQAAVKIHKGRPTHVVAQMETERGLR